MPGQATNGNDTEMLITEDERAELSIYVLPNPDKISPNAYLKMHMTDRASELDYLRVTNSFFVTSKFSGSSILYRRCNFAFNPVARIHCIDLAYPAAEKRAWDAPVTRISRSLRPLSSPGWCFCRKRSADFDRPG
jgi:hypothetical protein